jgi:hypothetical protein
MKTKKSRLLLLLLCNLGFSAGIEAQIFTPEGCPVTCYMNGPQGPPSYAPGFIDGCGYRYYLTGYNYTGNCHGYAFYTSEQYANMVGINYPQSFWNDQDYSNDSLPSYIEVDSSIATHVVICDSGGGIIHSMRKIQNSYPFPPQSENGIAYNCVSASLNCSPPDPGIANCNLTWHKYGGSGKVYKFYKLKTDHHGVLKNKDGMDYPKTWIGAGGIVHTISGTVTVPEGVTLTVKPGATVKVAPGASLIVYGTLIANGAPGNPIHFQRYDGQPAWDKIQLWGSGNQFSYCIFDGGTNNVYAAGSSNTSSFNVCTFKNAAMTGLLVRSTNATVDNCACINNAVGIAVYMGGHASIHQSTISDNTGTGVFIYGGTVENFTNNAVENNGSYGIYVIGTMYMGNGTAAYPLGSNPWSETPTTGAGKNRINNNSRTSGLLYEIFIEGSSQLYVGDISGNNPYYLVDGFNRISSTTAKYIYNLAMTYGYESQQAWQVPANKTFWNGSVGSWNFYGPIDYAYPLSGDASGGAGASTILTKTASPVAGNAPGTVLTSAIAAKLTEQKSTPAEQQTLIDLKNKMLEVRRSLNDPKNIGIRPRLIGKLNSLRLLDKSDATKENNGIAALLAEYRMRLVSRQQWDPTERLCNEAALVNEVQNVILNGDMQGAQDLVQKYSAYVQNDDNRRILLLAEVMIDEYFGTYKDAMVALNKVKAFQPDARQKRGFIAPAYDYLETTIRQEAKAAGVLLQEQQAEQKLMPTETVLLQNYPNPFNPSTVIGYQLPAAGSVKLIVYDILGREVIALADGMKEAGYYSATFDASHLASGIYFARMTVTPQNGGLSFTKAMKMLLTK